MQRGPGPRGNMVRSPGLCSRNTDALAGREHAWVVRRWLERHESRAGALAGLLLLVLHIGIGHGQPLLAHGCGARAREWATPRMRGGAERRRSAGAGGAQVCRPSRQTCHGMYRLRLLPPVHRRGRAWPHLLGCELPGSDALAERLASAAIDTARSAERSADKFLNGFCLSPAPCI